MTNAINLILNLFRDTPQAGSTLRILEFHKLVGYSTRDGSESIVLEDLETALRKESIDRYEWGNGRIVLTKAGARELRRMLR